MDEETESVVGEWGEWREGVVLPGPITFPHAGDWLLGCEHEVVDDGLELQCRGRFTATPAATTSA